MNFRKLRVESLEERALLAVVAGGIEQVAEFAAPTEATTWVVNTLDDPTSWDSTDDILSLREAIDSAATGDTIVFNSVLSGGTITLNGKILHFTKGIVIDASEIGGITINANGQSGVFEIWEENGEILSVKLSCLTITGGDSGWGGGIYTEVSVLTLVDCSITDNKASTGGGIYNGSGGTLTMINCSVTRNSASGNWFSGGGIFSDVDSNMTLSSCTVAENTAVYGGGIYVVTGNVSLTDTLIIGNTADNGGGIRNEGGALTLTDCRVVRNSASDKGGGIFGRAITLTNCIISENTANIGGGVYNYGLNYNRPTSMVNCTIADNTAAQKGGGLYNDKGTATLYNTIIAENYAPDSCDIYNSGNGSINGTPIFVSGYNSLSSFIGWFSSNSNLVYNPEQPLFFDSENGDYRLAIGSQAINVGNNDFVITETDLAGNERISGGTVDIGAYEWHRKWIVDTLGDVVDDHDGLLSLREAVTINSDRGDTIAFSPLLAGGGIVLNGVEIEITKSITIDASSIGGIVVDANQQSRVFNVQTGTTAPVELVGLTITGGKVASNQNENLARYGGGIFNSGNLLLQNCVVRGNYALNYGGGIFSDSTLTLINCNITGNSSGAYTREGKLITINPGYGGGIHNYKGTLTITNSTISDNVAVEGDGGGIYNTYYSTLFLTNCLIAGNIADCTGGGIYDDTYLTSTLTNCTVVNNTLSGKYSYNPESSGIIIGSRSTCYLYNTIVVDNGINISSYNVEGVFQTGYIYAYNTLSEFTEWTGSSDCLEYDTARPLFVDSQNGDFALAEQSQAANVGNNDYVVTEIDLAENPRIYGAIVDLGAYESLNITLEPPTILTGTAGNYVSYGANRHQIAWSEIDNTKGYVLEYSENGQPWTAIETSETHAIITGLTYGQDVTYRIRALGEGLFLDSDWSAEKTFNVCPMDINNDGDISGPDRSLMATAWGREVGDEKYRFYADINGDGDISGPDRNILGTNWGYESDDPNLLYPRPVAADLVFAEFESADIDFDADAF